MVDEILKALLWRSRLAVRAGRLRAFAGDGYVDPSYRPPALPFVSVVGPLSLAVEPERENGAPGQGLIAIPGYIVGAVRPDASALPSSGGLRLRFDRRARLALALTGLPTTPFSNAATGPAIAAAIQAAIAAAVAADQVLDDFDQPLDDALVDAALAQVAVRWSPDTRQLAISSGPGSATPGGSTSSVEVLPIAGDLAPLLGWTTPADQQDGRLRYHKLPAPRPVTVEVRLDLWTANQSDMAQMFDAIASTAPTRGSMALRPSLLAANPVKDASTITLLEQGEPTTSESLVHLEGGDGLLDRARGAQFVATAPAALTGGAFVLSGAGRIAASAYKAPLVPNPLFATNPAPLGFAVAMGVDLGPGSVAGNAYPLLTIARGATTVFSVSITIQSVNVPMSGPTLFGLVVARATLTNASGIDAVAETRWRVLLSALDAGGTLHARVDGVTGLIGLWYAGAGQLLTDPLTTPVQPTLVPGRPTTGPDMVVTLGSLGAPLPRPVSVSHLHVHAEPIGPLDPHLRKTVTRAAELRPGDEITLAISADGWRTSDAKFQALVLSTTGQTVSLSKPLPIAFARGGTLVFQEQCFFFQTGVKRRDDLLNRLYHTSFDYKVSALLEDPNALTSAVLVLTARQELIAGKLNAPPPRPRPTQLVPAPGSTSIDLDPTHELDPSHEVH